MLCRIEAEGHAAGGADASDAERMEGPAGSLRRLLAGEIAEAEGLARTLVNRLLRLTLLAPDIVEAILEGRQAKRLMLEELMGSMPSVWEEQRQRFARPRSKPTNCLQDDP
jgi:hypothetical protein